MLVTVWGQRLKTALIHLIPSSAILDFYKVTFNFLSTLINSLFFFIYLLFVDFQMDVMRSLRNQEGHSLCNGSRPPQPLNGRVIRGYMG